MDRPQSSYDQVADHRCNTALVAPGCRVIYETLDNERYFTRCAEVLSMSEDGNILTLASQNFIERHDECHEELDTLVHDLHQSCLKVARWEVYERERGPWANMAKEVTESLLQQITPFLDQLNSDSAQNESVTALLWIVMHILDITPRSMTWQSMYTELKEHDFLYRLRYFDATLLSQQKLHELCHLRTDDAQLSGIATTTTRPMCAPETYIQLRRWARAQWHLIQCQLAYTHTSDGDVIANKSMLPELLYTCETKLQNIYTCIEKAAQSTSSWKTTSKILRCNVLVSLDQSPDLHSSIVHMVSRLKSGVSATHYLRASCDHLDHSANARSGRIGNTLHTLEKDAMCISVDACQTMHNPDKTHSNHHTRAYSTVRTHRACSPTAELPTRTQDTASAQDVLTLKTTTVMTTSASSTDFISSCDANSDDLYSGKSMSSKSREDASDMSCPAEVSDKRRSRSVDEGTDSVASDDFFYLVNELEKQVVGLADACLRSRQLIDHDDSRDTAAPSSNTRAASVCELPHSSTGAEENDDVRRRYAFFRQSLPGDRWPEVFSGSLNSLCQALVLDVSECTGVAVADIHVLHVQRADAAIEFVIRHSSKVSLSHLRTAIAGNSLKHVWSLYRQCTMVRPTSQTDLSDANRFSQDVKCNSAVATELLMPDATLDKTGRHAEGETYMESSACAITTNFSATQSHVPLTDEANSVQECSVLKVVGSSADSALAAVMGVQGGVARQSNRGLEPGELLTIDALRARIEKCRSQTRSHTYMDDSISCFTCTGEDVGRLRDNIRKYRFLLKRSEERAAALQESNCHLKKRLDTLLSD